tara:strand:- start:1359 stop:2648 length:1290 start_codon:yes stop_codon:yes gene_type:complete
MPTVVIPYKPREVQKHLHKQIDKHRFSVIVAHRRLGKSLMTIMHLIKDALRTKKKNYRGVYVAPTITMAKSVAWDYVKTFTEKLPNTKYNEAELRVDFSNGSRLQLVGANDGGQKLRGRYFDSCVLDETQMLSADLFNQIIRPALVDRNGLEGEHTWCVFIGTPQLQNYFYQIFEYAQKTEGWYSVVLPVSETKVVPESELEQAKKIMGEDAYEQEFECSFNANISGSFYGKLMQKAYDEGRIGKVDEDLDLETEVYLDLGMNDNTAMWFVQRHKHEYRFIDYAEFNGEGLQYLADFLEKRGYVYSRIVVPHDIRVKELGTGVSRLEIMQSLGVGNIEIAPKLPLNDGIESVRHNFDNFWFDETKCAEGIQHLKAYTKVYDARHRIYRNRPKHDNASHSADALRYGMVMGGSINSKWDQPLNLENRGIV